MRKITDIVIHCSATGPGADIGVKEIRDWHMKQNGWKDIGYHFVIRRDGAIENGRPMEQVGAHVSGHNANSIGVCLVGGVDSKGKPEANYTPDQWAALKRLLCGLGREFPGARILGHRDFPNVKKDCPCFDVADWLNRENLAC